MYAVLKQSVQYKYIHLSWIDDPVADSVIAVYTMQCIMKFDLLRREEYRVRQTREVRHTDTFRTPDTGRVR